MSLRCFSLFGMLLFPLPNLNWQGVIDYVAAEIWIVTVRLATLVCSPRTIQQRIAARL